jgi:hypothetical protein
LKPNGTQYSRAGRATVKQQVLAKTPVDEQTLYFNADRHRELSVRGLRSTIVHELTHVGQQDAVAQAWDLYQRSPTKQNQRAYEKANRRAWGPETEPEAFAAQAADHASRGEALSGLFLPRGFTSQAYRPLRIGRAVIKAYVETSSRGLLLRAKTRAQKANIESWMKGYRKGLAQRALQTYKLSWRPEDNIKMERRSAWQRTKDDVRRTVNRGLRALWQRKVRRQALKLFPEDPFEAGRMAAAANLPASVISQGLR